jgi:hypothetical protein
MPRFIHEPWCDPRLAHRIDGSVHYYDLTCQSEVFEMPTAWAQLEQSPEDRKPVIHMHLLSDEVTGPYDVKLTEDSAVALVQTIHDRPDELADFLDKLADVRMQNDL